LDDRAEVLGRLLLRVVMHPPGTGNLGIYLI